VRCSLDVYRGIHPPYTPPLPHLVVVGARLSSLLRNSLGQKVIVAMAKIDKESAPSPILPSFSPVEKVLELRLTFS